MTGTVLAFQDLSVDYQAGGVLSSALSHVTLDVQQGEILGIVGESGCGKTTLAMATIGLLPANALVHGQIRFQGDDLHGLSDADRRRLRGRRIAMVIQDPLSSLDPAFSIGSQVAETIQQHQSVSRKEARARAVEMLREVGIASPDERYGDPPHRFSGGMRQRVVIAAALANDPPLLLADEPTSALDVTIQAQILTLLRRLARSHGTTIVLITHDLGVVAQICDRVAVMYAGQLVEVAPVSRLFSDPNHPYTQALLAALPAEDQAAGSLRVIPGQLPDPTAAPDGCRFAPRCPYRMPTCEVVPDHAWVSEDHSVACWLHPPGDENRA